MATPTNLVYTRARGKIGLGALLQRIPGASRMTTADAKSILIRMGLAALARIKEAFIQKSRGGTDAAGERWQPLSPYTIAYKRRHPLMTRSGTASKRRLPGASKRAGSRPSYQLNAAQRRRWWGLYRKFLSIYKGDKSHAAAVAWIVLKEEGAKTLLEVYGHSPVEILRDTGLLLNSLSPGVTGGSASVPRNAHSVFRIGKGEVTIGTNRVGAAGHHRGIPGRLPQRRLWPPLSKWPKAWWEDIGRAAREGVIEVIKRLVEGGAT